MIATRLFRTLLALWVLALPGMAFAQETRPAGPNDGEASPEQTSGQASQGARVRSADSPQVRTKTATPNSPAPPPSPSGAATVAQTTAPASVRISIGNTGTTDWDYRNTRNPPLVWSRDPKAPVDLHFFNVTSGIVVKLTFDRVVVKGTRQFTPLGLLGLKAEAFRDEARRQLAELQRLADEAVAAATSATGLAPAAPIATLLDAALTLRSHLAAAETPIQCAFIDWKHVPIPGSCETGGDSQVRKVISDWRVETGTAPVAGMPLSLDNVRYAVQGFDPGFASSRGFVALKAAVDALPTLSSTLEAALPKSPSSDSSVMAPPVDEAGARTRAQELFGVLLEDCRRDGPNVICTPTLTIAPNSFGVMKNALLANYPAKTKVRFLINFPFSVQNEQPAAPAGYFSLDREINASESSARWSATGISQLVRTPDLGDTQTPVDDRFEYGGHGNWQSRGAARIAVNLALADRATGSVELQYKAGALGSDGLAVSASQYHFEAFGYRGTSFKFGKYTFAAPTDGIAINETGEGATARYRWVGISRIVRREESTDAIAPRSGDHSAWLIDASNISHRSWTLVRYLSLYGLYGRDDVLSRPRNYWVAGGEVLLSSPALPDTSGTLAHYRGGTRGRQGSLAQEGRGSTTLARISRTWSTDSKPSATAVFTYAHGTGDRSDTPNQYEGYVGENAAFPESSLFVSNIAPKLRLQTPVFQVDGDGKVVEKDGVKVPEFSDRGLANRQFLGATVTSLNYSPLRWLAVGWVPDKDVKAKQTSLRLHYYRTDQPLRDAKYAGWEFQAETLLESPEGVKYSLRYSRFFAGDVLSSLFPSRPWSLLAQCIVTIKT